MIDKTVLEWFVLASIAILFFLAYHFNDKQKANGKKAEEALIAKTQLKQEVEEIKDGVKKTLDKQNDTVTNYAVMAAEMRNLNHSQKELQNQIKFLIESLVKGQGGD